MDAMVLNEAAASELRVCARPRRPPSVEVRDVALAFGGQAVLDGVTIDLRSGETVLLRGGNGSGKTALLNLLCGYLSPDAGSVRLELGGARIDPVRVAPERLARLGVGRLWQDIRLFPTMTVLDNVLAATPRLPGGWPLLAHYVRPVAVRDEQEARAVEHLRRVGMAARAHSSCDMLSVGQMKRVALARLLQMEARLLLLDEPFAGLDAAAIAALAEDLERVRDDGDRTVLVVEHRGDALAVDRTWTMRDGSIREDRGRRG